MQIVSHQTVATPCNNIPATPRSYFLLFAFLFGASILPTHAAPLSGNPLNDGYHDLYNLDFDSAHQHFQQWMTMHPEDPMGPASDAAASLFSEFNRLHIIDVDLFADQERFDSRQKLTPDPNVRKNFDDRAAQADRLADTAIQHNPNDAMALLCQNRRRRHAVRLRSHDRKARPRRLSLSKQASAFSRKALALNPTLYDAYLATGVENYMLSLKSAPLRWILGMTGAVTNKEEGIRLLHITAAQGHYLAPFARMMLAVAAIRDGHPQEARDILSALSREYPQNTMYVRQLARIH